MNGNTVSLRRFSFFEWNDSHLYPSRAFVILSCFCYWAFFIKTFVLSPKELLFFSLKKENHQITVIFFRAQKSLALFFSSSFGCLLTQKVWLLKKATPNVLLCLRDALYGMVDFFCSFYTPLDFLSRKGACFNFQFEAFGGHKLFVRKEETK